MRAEFAPVPAEKVAEVVRLYMGRDTQEQVAARAGIGEKRLREILAGDGDVEWDIADRLVCAVRRPDAWFVELADAA